MAFPIGKRDPIDHQGTLSFTGPGHLIKPLVNRPSGEDGVGYLWVLTQAAMYAQYFLRVSFNSSSIRAAVIPSLGKALA